MSEFQQLVQNSIPCARGVLQDNYRNLLQVADYCESNYEAAQDKRKALEETMAFATQSLASVACQISNLASDILKMLDLQATEVRKVEANVCSITQVVEMHTEKVARREIGTFAVCKKFPHYQKIIYPDHIEPLEAYYRKPLNFSSLDEIGHGIKDQNTQLARTGTLARRGTKTSASQSSGSLGRSQRVPEPIRPPVIPDGKLSAASSSSSLSGPTGTSGGPGVSAPTEPPPPPPLPLPSLSPAFPPPTETDDVPLPTQEDILPPPPPVTMDDAPSLLLSVVTLYPYAQQKGNELSFEEGTVIYMTRRYSDGWCEGVTSEGEGFFPGNYVEPLA
ncbi:ABI gene family member 3 isoform X2 [Hemicordylus capensis]|uniref:ABI gene family member 3 isoform X2 n=1 Tax=Hemicordylus capensis TaxID=884348 RepID=UPI0023034CF8|nr:ABI gene family member 3 isoform X2 [Hemicordylus capensis]